MSSSAKVFEKLLSVFKCGPIIKKKRTVSVESLNEWDELVAEVLGIKIKPKSQTPAENGSIQLYGLKPFKLTLSTIYEVSEEDELDETSHDGNEDNVQSVPPKYLPKYEDLRTFWEMSV